MSSLQMRHRAAAASSATDRTLARSYQGAENLQMIKNTQAALKDDQQHITLLTVPLWCH